MEYFVTSLCLYPFIKAYCTQRQYIHKHGKFIRQHQKRNSSDHRITYDQSAVPLEHHYELCHSSQVKSELVDKIAKILKRHSHIPTLIELLDYHGILQTLASVIVRNMIRAFKNCLMFTPFRHSDAFLYKREFVTMSDGGTVALDWGYSFDMMTKKQKKHEEVTIKDLSKEKIVILLHGILGNSQAEHLYFLVPQLVAAGYTPVVYIARGCDDNLPLTSDSFFSGKLANDLYEIVRYLKLTYQQSTLSSASSGSGSQQFKLFAVGFSLGASSLLNYLTKMKEFSFLNAAVSVCPPWNIIKNSEKFIAKLFSALIGFNLKLYFFKHYSVLKRTNPQLANEVSIWKILTSLTVGDYDNALYKTFCESTLTLNYEKEKRDYQQYLLKRKHEAQSHQQQSLPASNEPQPDMNPKTEPSGLSSSSYLLTSSMSSTSPSSTLSSSPDSPAVSSTVAVVDSVSQSTTSPSSVSSTEIIPFPPSPRFLTKELYQPIVRRAYHQSTMSYYLDINSSDNIHDIETPTITIAAMDDPVCPHDNIPSGAACDSFGSNVVVVRAFPFFCCV
jgi:predicted alpha/beta-fold hydrolase